MPRRSSGTCRLCLPSSARYSFSHSGGRLAAPLSTGRVAAEVDRGPGLTTERTQIALGLLPVPGVVLQVHHQVAQERAQSPPVLVGQRMPVGRGARWWSCVQVSNRHRTVGRQSMSTSSLGSPLHPVSHHASLGVGQPRVDRRRIEPGVAELLSNLAERHALAHLVHGWPGNPPASLSPSLQSSSTGCV